MRNEALAELNFREIIDYGGPPLVEHTRPRPAECHGYCISCDKAGLAKAAGGDLTLMSHGCDTSDYETYLGPMPRDPREGGRRIDAPVMFLLESPGGQSQLGQVVQFQGYNKEPPVNHFYWLPHVRFWPTRIEEFNGDFSGPYYAYLMRRHQLSNVYITNAAKCGFRLQGNARAKPPPKEVFSLCIESFLAKEIAALEPRVVFCFGQKAEHHFRRFNKHKAGPNLSHEVLWHPSFISDRCQTQHKTRQECVDENDATIRRALQRI